jgi:hypothetical protein
MTLKIPLVLDVNGDIQQLQPGDTIAAAVSNTLQNFGGNVAAMSGTTLIPFGNQAPGITTGTQVWSQIVTPPFTNSSYAIDMGGFVDSSGGNVTITVALFRGTLLIGYVSVMSWQNNKPEAFSIKVIDTPGVITPVTYSCRVGVSNGGSWYLGKPANSNMGNNNTTGWSIEGL